MNTVSIYTRFWTVHDMKNPPVGYCAKQTYRRTAMIKSIYNCLSEQFFRIYALVNKALYLVDNALTVG